MEKAKITRWKRFVRFLGKKYRLVILNDTTFGESFSLRLTPFGILIGALAITIVMTTLVISLIAFTSLREYIPGYGDIAERKQILELNIKADSLEQALAARQVYLTSVLKAVNEEVETKTNKPKKDTTGKFSKLNISPSQKDIQFRTEYEQNKGNASSNLAKLKYTGLGEAVFFTPVNGLITESFDLSQDHFGVDIVTKQDEAIKSTLDGTVIFTGFSAGDGNVVHVQHSNNLISIYKHCSTYLKSVGDRVKSGEAIAIVGNTGEKSHGSHLHFELWFNGSPVNPQDFVAF
jgi:murein DD-endopeptidase MepM/ murein hydrolase activator NlpD